MKGEINPFKWELLNSLEIGDRIDNSKIMGKRESLDPGVFLDIEFKGGPYLRIWHSDGVIEYIDER